MGGPERPVTMPAPGGSRRAGEPARPALPTGTVTFLFTDIEGSTHLVGELAERWPPLLDRHRAIIRAALAAHGGVEVQTEGDGFFAAFDRAPAAVAATVRAQRDLAAEAWPPDAAIRVRMGLHTGEGVVDADGSYVGHDVHRAARVAGAAHGGQVLLSGTVRALAGAALPAGVTLRDLGEHRLKDLRPEPLAQLVVDGLPADFPPVRSLDARPNNLPTQLTSFVGREHELAAAAELLAATRLLTLTGPGGTGKTRLSLQLAAAVADAYPDGVWFVALEPLRDPSLVLPTVARTIGVVQGPTESVLDALVAALGTRQVLLVLDNFEQVVEAAGDVGGLLRACPRVRLV
ncbi:MAG: adenylate/guanylate cyclase domain-containing protein, partial [Chloroflexota bacterium]